MTSVRLASEGGGAASCGMAGECHGVEVPGSGRHGESMGQVDFSPESNGWLEEAAKDAGSVIGGSLQFQDGVWGANVLTGEQARRLRSSYVNITQAFWDAFQPGTAGDDMARMESERKQLRCRLALLELARSITPDSGCLEPTDFILPVLAVDKTGQHVYEFNLNEPLTVGRKNYGNRLVLDSERIKMSAAGVECCVTSRIQAVIIYVPVLQQIVIVDLGTELGMRIVDRSTATCGGVSGSVRTREEDCSGPTGRRPLLMQPDETVVLKFYDNSYLVLNPKLCLICNHALRQLRASCGHLVMCKACYLDLSLRQQDQPLACPLCRLPLSSAVPVVGGPTYVQP